MYKALVNPTEKEVTSYLEQGYELHSVTPTLAATGHFAVNQHVLIYHLIKYPTYEYKGSEILEKLEENLLKGEL